MPRTEKSSLKRGRVKLPSCPDLLLCHVKFVNSSLFFQVTADHDPQDQKKPRRSERISSQQQLQTPVGNSYLPTPLTHHDSTATDLRKEVTATPPSQARLQSPSSSDAQQPFSSPPGDTQALSQFVYPPRAFADEVEDEVAEGVWGYLIPLDDKVRNILVLRKRDSCKTDQKSKSPAKKGSLRQRKGNAADQPNGRRPGGYLIGRHPECGKWHSKERQ